MPASDRCSNPDCRSIGAKRKVDTRGLCEACYAALRRRLKELGLTLEDAERNGWVQAAVPRASRRWPHLAEGGAGVKVAIGKKRLAEMAHR